jgi:pimeloyl-ACP methyl ester carboxylesterase
MPLARVRACRAALEREADLTQYTTAASVDDLERVREALGFERINLDGGSYGTRLALEYIRAHGDRVRTALLDGVVPPSVPVPERFGVLAQRALDGILARCAADPACVRDVPHPVEDARAAFARVAAAPVTATILHGERPATVTLQRETVAEAIRYMTYSSGAAARVPRGLHAAAGGDFDAIARFLYDWRAGGGFDALYLSITCAEDVPFVAADAEAADDRTYLTAYRIREQRAACGEWPRAGVPATHRQPVVSDVPVLLFSGTLDPVTPPSGAEKVARHLSHSRSFVIPDGAHTLGSRRTDPCIAGILGASIDTARVTNLPTACLGGSGGTISALPRPDVR